MTDKEKSFYYSETGNKKIEYAFSRNENYVYLNNEDVNMTIISHKYFRDQRRVKHLQSGK